MEWDSFGMRYNWQARCNHSVGIVGEEQRCGESVGMAAGDLIGLNATLGRGLNINALPRNECRVGDTCLLRAIIPRWQTYT